MAFLVLFGLWRLAGLTLPYHQDEWKTVSGLALGAAGASGLYHPPLTQLIYRAGYALLGPNYLRVLPLFFSLLSAWLLWLILKKRFDWQVATVGLFLFTTAFYSVWASLMIDTDGAILPAFFLLTVFAYDRAQVANRRVAYWWWGLTILAIFLGGLVKLSFVLVPLALLIDLIIEHRQKISQKHFFYGGLVLAGSLLVFIALIFISHLIYPAFNIKGMIDHARSFVNFANRNYLQIVVQAIKAMMYLSPLLILPLFYLTRNLLVKLRLFFIFLGAGFIFYFVLFDFSTGALDKYLMFTIAPLAIICGAIIGLNLKPASRVNFWLGAILGLALFVLLFSLNFLSHDLVPLYPKTAWFARVITGQWRFLNPFTGGSGPLGFYVSFLFIMLSFIVSLVITLVGYLKPSWRPSLLISVLLIGLIYNGVFAEELFFGRINGSAPVALQQSLSFIADNQEVKQVITYNDLGAYELTKLNK